MSKFYDVIVVGAGPAGATAAFFLAEAGKNVLVLEKETLPRYKTCGGGISLRFLKDVFPFSFDEVVETDARAMTYTFGRYAVTIPVKSGVIGMVMRDQFDAHIMRHSRAVLRQEVSVHNIREVSDKVIVKTTQGERFECNYLIGADGANSMVARTLNLRPDRDLVAAIEVEVEVPQTVFSRYARRPVFIFGELKLGYLWIFPKSDHLSVGIAALHPRRGELQAKLKEVMQRFNITLNDAQLHGHPIPLYTRREPIATTRTLLVGDAAGLVDPLSGEGIRYAIKSAQIASQTILNGHPERYQGLIYQQIGRNHILARMVALIFYRLQWLCLALGAPNPFTTQAIMDLLSDRAGTYEVMLRAIVTLPVYLLTEFTAALAGIFSKQFSHRIRAAIYSLAEAGAPLSERI